MKQIVSILKTLGDRNRLRILKLLEDRPMCVCEIAQVLGISQPSVSRHLKVLVKELLIAGEQDGLWTNYSLAVGSKEAKALYSLISMCIDQDEVVSRDLECVKKVDRTCLCGNKQ